MHDPHERTLLWGPLRNLLTWLVVCLLTGVFTVLVFVAFLVSLPFDRTGAWPHRVTTEWGRAMIRLMPGWRVRTDGLEHVRDGPFVIAANHQSQVDIWVMYFLPLHFKWLSKRSVFYTPFMGLMMLMCRYIPVVRGDRRSVVRAMARSADWIRRGVSVVFFPEGTRSSNGQIGSFKPGAFSVAARTGAAVLPVVILGTGAALPKSSWRFAPKGDLRLVVGRPIPVEGLTSADLGDFSARVRERLLAIKQAAEAEPGPLMALHPTGAGP